MVLLYARGAKVRLATRARRLARCCSLAALFLSFAAIMVSRSWFVYDLLADELAHADQPSSFIWSPFADGGFVHAYWNLVFPFTVSSVAGTCLALWKVRRRPRG